MKFLSYCLISLLIFCGLWSCNDGPDTPDPNPDRMQLRSARMGNQSILGGDALVDPSDRISLVFSESVRSDAASHISLLDEQGVLVDYDATLLDMARIVELSLSEFPIEGEELRLEISADFRAESGAAFPGISLEFAIAREPLEIISLRADDADLLGSSKVTGVSVRPTIYMELSHQVPVETLQDELVLVGDKNYMLSITAIDETNYEAVLSEDLADLKKLNLLFPSSIGTDVQRPFDTRSFAFYTEADAEPDFPIISDEELMTLVQEQTFKYFWDFAHPVSGMALERNTSTNTVTSGGSGFGLMAMIVGVERGFITRQEAVERWQKIMDFLEGADRFHGVWAHWMDGTTGAVRPFSEFDDGGDLVETAFLVEGMLTVRQYLDDNDPGEAALIDQINRLWTAVEWDWHRQGDQDVLYWHWSPRHAWRINLPLRGYNEGLITYILAAGAPTHSIPASVYDQGWARNGGIRNGSEFYNIELPLGPGLGGPLFFEHYSFLGVNPRNLEDQYASYWDQAVNHTLINRSYCVDNPQDYVGYSEQCWGLTASDGNAGYSAHSPSNDRGVITPTAALSSFPYTPIESMEAMRFFYYSIGDRLWGDMGFYDAFNLTEGWTASSYLAIDQGPIICMIENHRTGLLWDLLMSAPEVQTGLDKLGFSY